MRAKRSKKYRKIMQQYNMTFGFREPYQVLVDTNLLLALYAFHMPLVASLERTLHGQVKPFLTKCCLEALNARNVESTKFSQGPDQRVRRPLYLPSSEELPLRYCDHGDRGIISETECLLELVSGGAADVTIGGGKGKQPKNKEHYIIATADADAGQKVAPIPEKTYKRKREAEFSEDDKRALIRTVPGVPIIYVKRSVMILEELSAASSGQRSREEKLKMGEGVSTKRKRDPAEEDEVKEEEEDAEADEQKPKRRTLHGPKGPNPLSVKKKKKVQVNGIRKAAPRPRDESNEEKFDNPKPKRRRKHGKSGKDQENGEAVTEVQVES